MPATTEPAKAARRVFIAATLITLALGPVLAGLDQNLHTESATLGIASFELAGSRAGAMLADWSEAQRRDALLLQGLDYLFLTAYASSLALGCWLAARRIEPRKPVLALWTRRAVWAGALAGASDAVENVPLILMLRDGVASPSGATLAFWCASLKFSMVLVALLLSVVSWAGSLGKRQP